MFRLNNFYKSMQLANTPTPLERLQNLSLHLGGPPILIKRDDYTGLGFGGNKVRKLEFLMAEAMHQGADTVVTIGGIQSNHCRQTAAAAARCGLQCELVLVEGSHGETQYRRNGNLLLDRLFGARIHLRAADVDRELEMQTVCASVQSRGGKPFAISAGGSTATGSFGYMKCAEELRVQLRDLPVQAIVHSTGSGGTQAGLIAGLAAFEMDIPVIGISCGADRSTLTAKIGTILADLYSRINLGEPNLAAIDVRDEYVGPAYGVPTPEMMHAVELAGRLEGLALDPVYTGKAMAGLIDLIAREKFDRDRAIVFLHTGGGPALFGYVDTLDGIGLPADSNRPHQLLV